MGELDALGLVRPGKQPPRFLGKVSVCECAQALVCGATRPRAPSHSPQRPEAAMSLPQVPLVKSAPSNLETSHPSVALP